MTSTPGVLDKQMQLLTGLIPREVDELIADGTTRVEHALLLEVLTPEGVGTLIKRG